MKKMLSILIIIMLMLSTIGCGGGENPIIEPDPEPQEELPKITKQTFSFTPTIEGISYTCKGTNHDTFSGKTDNGTISCAYDDEVVFSIGKLELGKLKLTISMDKKILLQDLLGISRDKIEDEELVKLVAFLYSLDDDGSWGSIQIDSKAENAFNEIKNIKDIKSEDIIAFLEDAGFQLRLPVEFVWSDFLETMGMTAEGKGLTQLPTELSANEADSGKILLSGFQETLVLSEDFGYFDWSDGNLTIYSAEEGEYNLTFEGFVNEQVQTKTVKVVVDVHVPEGFLEVPVPEHITTLEEMVVYGATDSYLRHIIPMDKDVDVNSLMIQDPYEVPHDFYVWLRTEKTTYMPEKDVLFYYHADTSVFEQLPFVMFGIVYRDESTRGQNLEYPNTTKMDLRFIWQLGKVPENDINSDVLTYLSGKDEFSEEDQLTSISPKAISGETGISDWSTEWFFHDSATFTYIYSEVTLSDGRIIRTPIHNGKWLNFPE